MVNVGTPAATEPEEATLLSLVVDVSGNGFAVLDREGMVRRANRVMTDRRPSQSWVGQSFVELAPVELRGAYEQLWDDLLRTQGVVGWTSETGGRVWEDSLRPVPAGAGRPPRYLWFARDITQRHESQVALRDSEAQYRNLAEATEAGLGILTEDRVTFANPALLRFLGLEHPPPTFADLAANVHPEDRATFLGLHDGTAGSRKAVIRVFFDDENERLLAVSARRTTGPTTALCAHDYGDQEQLNRQVMQAEKEESMVALAGGLAHDFNNILVSVLSGASLLQDELPNDPKFHELVNMVTHGAQRIAELTGKLLTYSRGTIFRPRPLDLNAVVESAIQLSQATFASPTHIHVELDPTLPPLRGDHTQLQQLVITLLVNSAEAIHERAGNIWVRTRFEPTANFERADAVLQIEDDGEGMSEETRRRLFEPFYTTRFQGRGMGLAAAAGILRAHGAEVEVESRPEQGARFRIRFPIDLDRQSRWFRVQGAPQRPRSVLVVDDDAMVRRVVERILRRAEYHVVMASSGREGIELARSRDVGVMMVDIFMPDLRGDRVIEAVRASKPDLPIVVCSGYGRERALADVGSGTVQEFLMKPFVSEELVSTVEKARQASITPAAGS
jgi:signal transduction histidine kinase/ActR/RegA family two-component response regulator